MRKLSILLILCIAFGSFGFTAMAQDATDEGIRSILSSLNIMNGYPDGNFYPDNYLTRAQFAKIIIAASSYRNSVALQSTTSPFKDVPYTHWSAPYVKVASSSKLFAGYPDSTFRPDDNVKLEEAITVILRVLGYSNDDFGGSWPYGQVGLASNLDLMKNTNVGIGSSLTRKDTMNIIFNMLSTNTKTGNTKQIETFGYKYIEDVVLIATSSDDTSVGSDKILTSLGTYKIKPDFDKSNVGKKGIAILNNTEQLIAFAPSSQNIKSYSAYSSLGNDIIVYDGSSTTGLDLDENTIIYYKSQKTTLQSIISKIKIGDLVTVYKNQNNLLDYVTVSDSSTKGPITIASSEWMNYIGLNQNEVNIIRDGNISSFSNIQVNDVIYYSMSLKTVWAYSKKITGIYEKATPNKDSIKTVTVSGITYELETSSAINKLSSNGSFDLGDTVTLLMGRDGKIADVVSPINSNEVLTAYLVDTGKKEYQNQNGGTFTAYYITVALSDGNTYEYICDKDYSIVKSCIVKIKFENGVASAQKLLAKTDISGTVNFQNKTIGKTAFASDLKIIDIGNTDTNYQGIFVSVFPVRIDGVKLDTSDILYYNKNANNEISELYLNNVTGEFSKYVMMIKVSTSITNKSMSGKYEYDLNGSTFTYDNSGIFTQILGGMPVQLKFENGKVSGITALLQIKDDVININNLYVQTANKKYPISDKVVVYKKTNDYKYLLLPIDNIIGNNDYNISCYYDKNPEDGGRVRIIVVTDK